MPIFYAPQILENNFVLDETESKHCIQVLRKKTGDSIELIDGEGGFYKVKIITAHPKRCAFELLDKTEQKPCHQLHIAIAPTKSNNRLEWFVEKTVEIGITHIHPVFTQHSERKKLRSDRLRKIALTAVKQSKKALLPNIAEPMSLKQFWASANVQNIPNRYIAYVDFSNPIHLKNTYLGGDALVLIGPEGDFSPQEITLAQQNNFQVVSLGNSRLRTETAGIVACHILNLVESVF